jgi:hypothetical protein
MLTLDMDHGTPDVLDELSMFNSHEMCIYSTHKHTPEAPRLRLIMPLKRDVSEDEYPALARKVAQEIGMDMFDDTTYQPHRLMYWPSTSSNGEYVYKAHVNGDIAWFQGCEEIWCGEVKVYECYFHGGLMK